MVMIALIKSSAVVGLTASCLCLRRGSWTTDWKIRANPTQWGKTISIVSCDVLQMTELCHPHGEPEINEHPGMVGCNGVWCIPDWRRTSTTGHSHLYLSEIEEIYN